MIKSMTGYGAGSTTIGGTTVAIEVKTVNSKYLDLKTYMPAEYAGLEHEILKKLREALSRGRVDLYVNFSGGELDSGKTVSIDWALADQYYKLFMDIKARYNLHHEPNLTMFVAGKEIVSVQRRREDADALWRQFAPGLSRALAEVNAMREQEGRALALDLAGRCNLIREIVQDIARQTPESVKSYAKRLKERLAAIAPAELDPARMAQEVCYFADRCDIAEEITRLKSHIQQFLKFLEFDEPVGRRLDFLLQEMHREANTIGSKSADVDIAHKVVEIKSELEKLREQVQNVE